MKTAIICLLLLLSAFGCAPIVPYNQATILNVFHFSNDDPMLATIATCANAKPDKAHPVLYITKEMISMPSQDFGYLLAMYDPSTNIIYAPMESLTAPTGKTKGRGEAARREKRGKP